MNPVRVVYRLPGEQGFQYFEAGTDGPLPYTPESNLIPDGFVIAPYWWDDTRSGFVLTEGPFPIEGDLETWFKQHLTVSDKPIPESTTPEEYREAFFEMYHALSDEWLDKVVLSRLLHIPEGHDWGAVVKALSEAHPQAFVYALYHPDFGTWLGATPETLLEVDQQRLRTMALAGTLPIEEGQHLSEVPWSAKEYDEQEQVARFIEDTLRSTGASDIHRDGPQTVAAGKIAHLCTRYQAHLSDPAATHRLLSALHPTPAVCGLPPENAHAKIRQAEAHDRSLYTGFLGLHQAGQLKLFVNLRCMQVNTTGHTLYLGGGLTRGSVLEKEWTETEHKARTLRDQIQKIR